MRTIVFKAFLVGTAALATALVLIITLVTAFGEQFETSMWVSAVVGSYGIGSTVSGYLFVQSMRYRTALLDLADTHKQLKEAHGLLADRARRDGMTGMLNRAAFLGDVEAAACRRATGALMIIDADRFKAINDTYGHMTGDAALLSIVAAIRESIRAADPAGRLGGEEFAVFMRDVTPTIALAAAERIRAAVAALGFFPNGRERLDLSVSIGLELVSGAWAVSDALRNADRRLYQAKADGRNRVVANASGASAAA